MASIANDPNGRRRIEFVGRDGKRRTIRLGKATAKEAEAFRLRVDYRERPDAETAHWLAGLGDVLRDRLARVGLAERPAAATRATLGALLAEFFAAINVKPRTVIGYTQTRDSLAQHFGESKPLADIGAIDADRWRQWMKGEGLAEATIATRVKRARQIFKRGVRWEMLPENPFADVRAGSQANKSRMQFIGREDAGKVLAACPDAEWRLLFALSRYGGLRCPSEHLGLKWADVDWERGRLTVTSPKTERHEGGDSRVIPIFPELRPYLLEVSEQAEPGTSHVITRYLDGNQNLRTQLQRIIRRAGVKPWPKLFHNLRSTRQTELAETYPIHVVCAWLGNSRAVAQSHYLQVTDAHFEKAAQKATGKATEQGAESARTVSQGKGLESKKTPVFPGVANRCDSVHNLGITPTGLEPVTYGLEGRCSSN